MRVEVPFDITRDEARRRLKSSSKDIGEHIPGGMAEITTDWPTDNQMNMTINVMGQSMRGIVYVEESQLVFEIALPPALAFVEPMVAGAIKQQSQKLLA